MHLPPYLDNFLKRDLNTVIQQERLGSYKFQEVYNLLFPIKGIVDNVISSIQNADNLPVGFIEALMPLADEFDSIMVSALGYQISGDNNFNQRNAIISRAQNFSNSFFIGKASLGQGITNNYLSACLAILYSTANVSHSTIQELKTKTDNIESLVSHSISEVKQIAAESDAARNQIKSTFQNVNDIYTEMQKMGTYKVTQNYANIFKEEADRRIKSANLWMIGSVFGILFFVLAVCYIDKFLGLTGVGPENKGCIFLLATKLFLISFGIYLITFLIKQFNVNRHLATVNKHRQHALESYKLFSDSLDGNSTDMRNTLMLEVAKAIYDTGHTGYLSKSYSEGGPSIIELTRIMGEKKG